MAKTREDAKGSRSIARVGRLEARHLVLAIRCEGSLRLRRNLRATWSFEMPGFLSPPVCSFRLQAFHQLYDEYRIRRAGLGHAENR